MAHLAGRCTCGRRIRFPKTATYGDRWTCWKCGQTWTLATHGNPLHPEPSKAPPRAASDDLDKLHWYWVAGAVLLVFLCRSC